MSEYAHRLSNESPSFPWEDMANYPDTYFDTKKYASFSLSSDRFEDPCTLASMSGVFAQQLFDFYEPEAISAHLEAQKLDITTKCQAEEDAKKAEELSGTKKMGRAKTRDIVNNSPVRSVGNVAANSDEDADSEDYETYESDDEALGLVSKAEIGESSEEELASDDEDENELQSPQPEQPL